MSTAATTKFTIGTEANCSDGTCGEVSRVVVDPIAKAVTHLVIEPKHRRGLGRLVPLALITVTDDAIEIHCTQAEFDELLPAEETEFLPGSGGYGGYGSGQAYSWPYYGIGGMYTGGGMGVAGGGMGVGNAPQPVTYDAVPLGEVAVHRGEHVHATDGEIGKVQGLVIDPSNHHVTHVLLQEGHLWGKKEVAIPISAVTRVDDGIRLNIAKGDVQDLPSVNIDYPNE